MATAILFPICTHHLVKDRLEELCYLVSDDALKDLVEDSQYAYWPVILFQHVIVFLVYWGHFCTLKISGEDSLVETSIDDLC